MTVLFNIKVAPVIEVFAGFQFRLNFVDEAQLGSLFGRWRACPPAILEFVASRKPLYQFAHCLFGLDLYEDDTVSFDEDKIWNR